MVIIMKYVVVLYDGMADYPVPALGGKTPMMCAKKPNMDYLAKRAEVGLIRTVAPGLKPGSDVANMSVLGFDPMKYYTGRSPLEAASIGIDMKPTDVSLRTNLVTLSEDDLPYIFDRFYKVRSEENKSGSGLGLAIAKQIADRHGVEISVSSRLGIGTEYKIKF